MEMGKIYLERLKANEKIAGISYYLFMSVGRLGVFAWEKVSVSRETLLPYCYLINTKRNNYNM